MATVEAYKKCFKDMAKKAVKNYHAEVNGVEEKRNYVLEQFFGIVLNDDFDYGIKDSTLFTFGDSDLHYDLIRDRYNGLMMNGVKKAVRWAKTEALQMLEEKHEKEKPTVFSTNEPEIVGWNDPIIVQNWTLGTFPSKVDKWITDSFICYLTEEMGHDYKQVVRVVEKGVNDTETGTL